MGCYAGRVVEGGVWALRSVGVLFRGVLVREDGGVIENTGFFVEGITRCIVIAHWKGGYLSFEEV